MTLVQTPPKKIYIWVDEGWSPGADTLAYYPFTSDRKDYSSYGNDVTSANSTILTTVGGVDCMDMNNSYCTINLGSSSPLLVKTLPYTIVFWTKAKDSGLSRAFAINWYENGSRGGSGITTPTSSGGQLEVRAGNTTNTNTKWYAGSSYANTNWHLYVASWGTSGLNVYVDGNTTPVKTTSWTTGPTNNGSPLKIGQRQDSTVCGNGYISRVIIEKKAWTAQDAADYYNETKSIYGIS